MSLALGEIFFFFFLSLYSVKDDRQTDGRIAACFPLADAAARRPIGKCFSVLAQVDIPSLIFNQREKTEFSLIFYLSLITHGRRVSNTSEKGKTPRSTGSKVELVDTLIISFSSCLSLSLLRRVCVCEY